MTSPQLLLGPLLRYVGERDATVWVETDRPCEVEVLGCTRPDVHGERPPLRARRRRGSRARDDQPVLGHPGRRAPCGPRRGRRAESTIRTQGGDSRCGSPSARAAWRAARGALVRSRRTSTRRAARSTRSSRWRPHARVRPGRLARPAACSAIRSTPTRCRPATSGTSSRAPRSQRRAAQHVADFEEYCHLYRRPGHPLMRWLLSTVPTTMIFDDHDVHDDWNTSDVWVARSASSRGGASGSSAPTPPTGSTSTSGTSRPGPARRRELPAGRRGGDATEILRDFAIRAEREPSAGRWSFRRDLGRTRLVVVDSRAGRVLEPERRDMLDKAEWSGWTPSCTGDVDHLLIGTSLPFLLAPGMHHLEAWTRRSPVGSGAGWRRASAESLRQGLDLEHWAAFDRSFRRLDRAAHRRGLRPLAGRAPSSVGLLSGDVHHAYVAEVDAPGPRTWQSVVAHLTCSPSASRCLGQGAAGDGGIAQSAPVRAITPAARPCAPA